jgi:hypothetical protein
MTAILGSPLFVNFALPLVTVALSIYVKCVSRNDRQAMFKLEDIAVGLDVAVTAILIFLSDSAVKAVLLVKSGIKTVDINDKLVVAPWMLMLFLLGIWGVSTIVRRIGWKDGERGYELHPVWGIVFPDAFGFLVLILVVTWIA